MTSRKILAACGVALAASAVSAAHAQPMIGQTRTKSLPVCYHGQSSVFAAIELRERVDLKQIDEIQVDGYQVAVFMMGGDASRWAPTTRETADHSLPYCVAIGLLDGELTSASFSDERVPVPACAHRRQRRRG